MHRRLTGLAAFADLLRFFDVVSGHVADHWRPGRQRELVLELVQLEAAGAFALWASLPPLLLTLHAQNYTLSSQATAIPTRSECKRLLEALGAQAIVEDADGAGILKCRVSELRDPSQPGTLASVKLVKFRVEFTTTIGTTPPATPTLLASPRLGSDAGGDFNACVATFVMEKGAHSSFKLMCGHLRRIWRCVALP